MQRVDSLLVPQPDESLGQYIRRLRQQQGLSQKAVVGLAGIHLQSLGKIERGKTLKLNHKTSGGLACVKCATRLSGGGLQGCGCGDALGSQVLSELLDGGNGA